MKKYEKEIKAQIKGIVKKNNIISPSFHLHNNFDQLSIFATCRSLSAYVSKKALVSIFRAHFIRNPQFPHSYPHIHMCQFCTILGVKLAKSSVTFFHFARFGTKDLVT